MNYLSSTTSVLLLLVILVTQNILSPNRDTSIKRNSIRKVPAPLPQNPRPLQRWIETSRRPLARRFEDKMDDLETFRIGLDCGDSPDPSVHQNWAHFHSGVRLRFRLGQLGWIAPRPS